MDIGPVNAAELDDSGVVDGSASDATPSSLADALNSDPLPIHHKKEVEIEPEKPMPVPDITTREVNVDLLEEYVMSRHDNDRDALRKEYGVNFAWFYKYCMLWHTYVFDSLDLYYLGFREFPCILQSWSVPYGI